MLVYFYFLLCLYIQLLWWLQYSTRWLYCVECPQYSTRQRSACNIRRSGMLRKSR